MVRKQFKNIARPPTRAFSYFISYLGMATFKVYYLLRISKSLFTNLSLLENADLWHFYFRIICFSPKFSNSFTRILFVRFFTSVFYTSHLHLWRAELWRRHLGLWPPRQKFLAQRRLKIKFFFYFFDLGLRAARGEGVHARGFFECQILWGVEVI